MDDIELIEGAPDEDDGPTLEEAKAAAAALVHEPLADAADLPSDVRDGEISDEPEAPPA